MLEPGRTFASYEVLRRLAVGGMGEVYLCRHRLLDRIDAVKVLRPHLAEQPDFRRRFLREALSAARLRHPGVVTVYTADEADGLLYLAMEHVVGRDLASILDDGRLDPARTVRLLAVVADALDAAHAANLVHRDIKPSNLLVTGESTGAESVTLVDFGISRRYDTDSDITRTGEIVGTIAYCAPEQLSGAPVDGSCDQYALACVAYECLTGSVPFPRESQLAMVTAHLTAPPPAVTGHRPELPAAVDVVLARGLAKVPAARYPSCGAFVAALTAALGSGPPSPQPMPGPGELVDRLGSDPDGLLRPAGHPDFLLLRVGAGLELSLAGAGAVLRADDATTASMATWLVAQAVARHPARELCLAAALAPVPAPAPESSPVPAPAPEFSPARAPGQTWLWLNWLPHARPTTAPLSGPHVATGADAAADLLARLRGLVRTRAELGAAGPAVLAVLDTRLSARTDDPGLAGAAQVGVHVLFLDVPGASAPAGMSTVDVLDGRCRVAAGGRSAEGRPDLVPAGYGREVADLLPDS